MRTAGLTMNDVWAGRVLREPGTATQPHDEIDAEIGVLVESVELQHRGKEEQYRPYLHLSGELRWVAPTEPLPFGISRVTYSPNHGERVDAYYEFDDQQLSALASKGYFTRGFTVPEQIIGIEWELPATIDVLVLAPSDQHEDSPVVFTRVHEIASLEIDLTSSGYDLAEYFADHSARDLPRMEAIVDERELRARSDAINSLFAEDELDLAEPTALPAEPDQADAAGEVTTPLREVEAQIAAERAQYQAERARTAGTPENLYHERVAEALRAAEQEAAGSTADAHRSRTENLDLEHGVGGQAGKPRDGGRRASNLDERKRDVSRRVADLDVGEHGEHSLGS